MESRGKRLVVKVPHEALDTSYYLPLNSLFDNFLRPMGYAPVTGRLAQGGLVTNIGPIRALLASERFSSLLVNLRQWPKFNAMVLVTIRAVEGKTFKSQGYAHARRALGDIAPFRVVEPGETVRLAWREGGRVVTRIFDYRDNIVVMEYVPHSMLSDLRAACDAYPDLASKTACFVDVFRAAGELNRRLVSRYQLWDLDTNPWADMGRVTGRRGGRGSRLVLIDPGELENLAAPEGKSNGLQILADRLNVDCSPIAINAGIDKLQYGSSLFRAYGYLQMEAFMEQEELTIAQRDQVRETCVAEVKTVLRAVLKTCLAPLGVASRHQPRNPDFWCIRKTGVSGIRPSLAQLAAVLTGSDKQGRFLGRRPNDQLVRNCVADFAVTSAAKGFFIDLPCQHGPKIPCVIENGPSVLRAGHGQVELYRGAGLGWIGAVETGLGASWGPVLQTVDAVCGAGAALVARGEPRVVLLDGGRGVRCGLLTVRSGKGRILLHDGRELALAAAACYRRIARRLTDDTGRHDLVVVGANDTLFEVMNDSLFLRGLIRYFRQTDYRGRQAGIFLPLPPVDVSGRELVPSLGRPGLNWLMPLAAERSNELAQVLPGVHILKRSLDYVGETSDAAGTRNAGGRAQSLTSGLTGLTGLDLVLRSEVAANGVRRCGGLRLPFFFVFSIEAFDALRRAFGIGGTPVGLDWYGLTGALTCESEEEFLATGTGTRPDERRRFFRAVREIRNRFWGTTFRDAEKGVWRAYQEDMAAQKLDWSALEGPDEIFGHYLRRSPPFQVSEVDQNRLWLMGNRDIAERLSLTASNLTVSGKTLATLLLGASPPACLSLALRPPQSEVASRSNLYPYFVYFINDPDSTTDGPSRMGTIEVAAQYLTVIVNGGAALRTPLDNVSKEVVENYPVESWDGERWRRNGLSVGQMRTKSDLRRFTQSV